MPRGIYPRRPRTGEKLRPVATCRACDWAWKPVSGFISESCPKCGKIKDVRARKDNYVTPERMKKMRDYRATKPGYSADATRRVRRTALLLVGEGKVKCIRCNCDQPEFLEINHKLGGGAKELKFGGKMYRDIALLRRDCADLELLCKPCNAVHALELKYGTLPFKVIWRGK